jgi:hypothetical protein
MAPLRQRPCLTLTATTVSLTKTQRKQLWASNNQQFGHRRKDSQPRPPRTISSCKENGQSAKGRANRMVAQTTPGTDFRSKRNSHFRSSASRSVMYLQSRIPYHVPRPAGGWSSNETGSCGGVPKMTTTVYSTVNIMAHLDIITLSAVHILNALCLNNGISIPPHRSPTRLAKHCGC